VRKRLTRRTIATLVGVGVAPRYEPSCAEDCEKRQGTEKKDGGDAKSQPAEELDGPRRQERDVDSEAALAWREGHPPGDRSHQRRDDQRQEVLSNGERVPSARSARKAVADDYRRAARDEQRTGNHHHPAGTVRRDWEKPSNLEDGRQADGETDEAKCLRHSRRHRGSIVHSSDVSVSTLRDDNGRR